MLLVAGCHQNRLVQFSFLRPRFSSRPIGNVGEVKGGLSFEPRSIDKAAVGFNTVIFATFSHGQPLVSTRPLLQ